MEKTTTQRKIRLFIRNFHLYILISIKFHCGCCCLFFYFDVVVNVVFVFHLCALSFSLFVYTHTMRATAVKCRSVSHSDVLMQCTICTHTHTPRTLCLSVGPPCDGCLLFFFCLVLFILLCYTHRLLSAPSLCVINTRARKSENKR